MTEYLISFGMNAMDFPEEVMPEISRAARAVIKEAMAAGVYVFTGGLDPDEKPAVVATDGTVTEGELTEGTRAEETRTVGMVTDGPYPESKELIGGFTVVDVPTRAEALQWAAKIAAACRCAQDVRVFQPGPNS
ncbi:YciI family protein [Kribbella sp. NPDC051586]|uniref:YciI family protein n=1 Tax=Kribbella sp. NPDC051586 TaxID=3364118 RepID=UPI0037BA7ED7